MALLNTLSQHSHFSTFEPAVGGKFPKSIYDEIIAEIQRMLTRMALMAHTAIFGVTNILLLIFAIHIHIPIPGRRGRRGE